MKNLTPEQIYWITLIGIAGCFLLIGLIYGYVRGRNSGWDDGYNEGWLDADDATAEFINAPEQEDGPVNLAMGGYNPRWKDAQPKHLHFTDLKTPPTWVSDDAEVQI